MYQKVLLTLDGSALARLAIPQVARLAGGTGAQVTVLEVIPTLEQLRMEALGAYEVTAGRREATETLAQDAHFQRREAALEELAAAAKALAASGVANVTTSVAEGLAGNAIVSCAEREGCDAIVMATRGHGGLGREVLGSVAEYVLRHAGRAAVVLVGPRGAE
jgi:nucleotide-binding universal stress UspA family protein